MPASNENVVANSNAAYGPYAQQLQWFNSHASPFRLAGTAVNIVVPSSFGQGRTLRASLVRDLTQDVVYTRKGSIGAQGMMLSFPPTLPLPSDPNAAGDTYTLRVCTDSNDSGVCDGNVWVVPLGQDYENTQNSNVVHYGFDQNGVTPPMVSGFIATVILGQAMAQNTLALQPNVEPAANFYSFTLSTVGEVGGGPGSSAEFILVSSLKITDTATSEVIYNDGAVGPASDYNDALPGEPFLVPNVMQQGHDYQILMYSAQGTRACLAQEQAACSPVCTVNLKAVTKDQLVSKPIDGCTAIQ